MQSTQLRVWRTTNRLSQEAASKHLGVSLKSYQRYEKGERAIPEAIAGMVMATPDISAPVDADPFIIPATHPELYKRIKGGYVHDVGHPSYGKNVTHKARVSELATYVPPEPPPPAPDKPEGMSDEDYMVWRALNTPRKAPEPAPVPYDTRYDWDDEEEE